MDLSAAVIATVVSACVAVLVAILATRREIQKAQIARLHEFADRRAQEYSEFLLAMNAAIGSYWLAQEASSETLRKKGSLANSCALKLDTKTYQIQLSAPDSVIQAAKQVNGAVQMSILDIGRSGVTSSHSYLEAFEAAKILLIKQMRSDLLLIEEAKSRRAYEKNKNKTVK
jgi:hypothetical protein